MLSFQRIIFLTNFFFQMMIALLIEWILAKLRILITQSLITAKILPFLISFALIEIQNLISGSKALSSSLLAQ